MLLSRSITNVSRFYCNFWTPFECIGVLKLKSVVVLPHLLPGKKQFHALPGDITLQYLAQPVTEGHLWVIDNKGYEQTL